MSVELKKLQEEVMRNKIEKGFNTTDVAEEFADVAIFLLGMCEILGYDLESELVRKIEINKNRKYKKEKSPDGKDVFIRAKTDIDP